MAVPWTTLIVLHNGDIGIGEGDTISIVTREPSRARPSEEEEVEVRITVH